MKDPEGKKEAQIPKNRGDKVKPHDIKFLPLNFPVFIKN